MHFEGGKSILCQICVVSGQDRVLYIGKGESEAGFRSLFFCSAHLFEEVGDRTLVVLRAAGEHPGDPLKSSKHSGLQPGVWETSSRFRALSISHPPLARAIQTDTTNRT
jgi:hypothetical protein